MQDLLGIAARPKSARLLAKNYLLPDCKDTAHRHIYLHPYLEASVLQVQCWNTLLRCCFALLLDAASHRAAASDHAAAIIMLLHHAPALRCKWYCCFFMPILYAVSHQWAA